MKNKYFLFLLLISFQAFSQISFLPYENKWTGSWPEVVKIGDVNNDGRNDVVLGLQAYGSSVNNHSILVYLQNANGTLDAPVRYPYATDYKIIGSIDIGDLNQDGKNDIIVGIKSPSSFYGIFYQNASGTLDPIVSTPITETIERVRIADMNRDGRNDIILSNWQNIQVLYQQNTAGTFQGISIPKPANAYYYPTPMMEIADMNNDSSNDLVIHIPNLKKVYTYFSSANTINPSPVIFDTGQTYDGMTLGDVNNDGKQDLLLCRGPNGTSKVRILHQVTGGAVYADQGEMPAYELPDALRVADLNNDGRNEIVAVHGGWSRVTVYSQNSSGNYVNGYQLFPVAYATSYNEDGLALGDINSDGRKDVVIADYNIGLDILYNTSAVLSVEETEKAYGVTIYPNPATDFIRIKGEVLVSRYELYDVSGRMIASGILSGSEVDVRNLSAGKYILGLHTVKNNGRVMTSFIKK
ncbi:T9SS type A sorting domain-containing protein [uncultured Chryseobacterium sp.]|uniref:T9SS type A sorting domain-containing protein n=1 Tax=uncultured Chryseobacterium sp. TaxID=259322 RepID=UPI0025F93167|nr:T9SS type A sorting domain-containing protein [uncultured Chryseobacterium sp.]